MLHPAQAQGRDRFCHAQALSDSLAGSDCAIVISSSWRFHYSTEEISAYLPKPLMARVVGMTGPAVIGPHPRYHEILTWLATSKGHDWRAIDDSAFEFPARCDELIHCEGSRGLGVDQLMKLRCWLEP